ncbi:lipoprotein-releasing ABC transporter permease subunit [Alteromonadaceae bacterium M269]|nr:lipoprotein-releasing ABC transporter permease subunit [Alteromonadaceae bacterium M269]
MNLAVSALVGMRYARASKSNQFIAFINVFSVAGIALGLMALIVVSSVMNGFEAQLKQRVLGISPHLMVEHSDTVEVKNWLENEDNVIAISPMIESEGLLQSSNGLRGVRIQGVEPGDIETESVVAQSMLGGSFRALEAGRYNVIIGRALALQLGLGVGDELRIISAAASVFGPLGRVPSQRKFIVGGIFDVGSELDDKVVLVHRKDLSRLMRAKVEKLSQQRIFLSDAFDFRDIKQNLEQRGLKVEDWQARQGPLFSAVKMEKNMISLMLMLIVAVAAFNIVSALVLIVTEKQGDIAILRTQGMHQSSVMHIFLFSGLYNGVKGALIGLVAGVVLATQLNDLLSLIGVPVDAMTGGLGLPVELHYVQITMMVLLSLLLCFLATLYPAYKAASVEPAQALRYE